MCFLLCLEKLFRNFFYSSLSLSESLVFTQMLLFLILDYIQTHKALSSFMTFFIKSYFCWTTFINAFAGHVLGWKVIVCTWEIIIFVKISDLHSNVAPCCIFVIYNTSSTIFQYMGAHLRFMLKTQLFSTFKGLLTLQPLGSDIQEGGLSFPIFFLSIAIFAIVVILP